MEPSDQIESQDQNSGKQPPSQKLVKVKKRSSSSSAIVVCTEETESQLVKQTLKSSNFFKLSKKNDGKWGLYWADIPVLPSVFKGLKQSQMINQFPGSRQFEFHKLIPRLLKIKKQFPDDYNFITKYWILPQDFNELKKFKLNGQTLFVKYLDMQGEEIPNKQKSFLSRNLDWLDESNRTPRQVSLYLKNPFLIEGRKFALKIYALLHGIEPMRIFVYQDGLITLARDQYQQPSQTNLENQCHFSNSPDDTHLLLSYIMDTDSEIHKKIQDIISKVILSSNAQFKHEFKSLMPKPELSSCCFQIFSFDFILDHEQTPWLLNVSPAPDLNPQSDVHQSLIQDLINKSMSLLFQIQPSESKNDFHDESIHFNNQVVSFQVPNGCEMVFPCQNVERQHKYEQIIQAEKQAYDKFTISKKSVKFMEKEAERQMKELKVPGITDYKNQDADGHKQQFDELLERAKVQQSKQSYSKETLQDDSLETVFQILEQDLQSYFEQGMLGHSQIKSLKQQLSSVATMTKDKDPEELNQINYRITQVYSNILAKEVEIDRNVVIFTNFQSDAEHSLEYNLKPYLQIKKLVEEGYVKTIITESFDGLQRLCGIPDERKELLELNGNDFVEYCHKCEVKYVRDFIVRGERHSRKCMVCQSKLTDKITVKELESVTNSARFASFESKVMISFLGQEPKIKLGQNISSRQENAPRHYKVFLGNQKEVLALDEHQNFTLKASPRNVLDWLLRNLNLETPTLKIQKQIKITIDQGFLNVSGINDQLKPQDMIVSSVRINDQLTDSFDLSGFDYEDIIRIHLSFPGHFNEKDIILKAKLWQIDHYMLFSGATRIVLVHNLVNWESAEIFYFSRHANHTHEAIDFEEVDPVQSPIDEQIDSSSQKQQVPSIPSLDKNLSLVEEQILEYKKSQTEVDLENVMAAYDKSDKKFKETPGKVKSTFTELQNLICEQVKLAMPYYSSKKDLPNFDYQDLVEGLKTGKFKKVAVLSGPEIRISAGYPDFRDNEKYDEELPDSQSICNLEYFKENPKIFYRFAKEYLSVGKFKPTKAHYFVKFLDKLGILQLYMTECTDKIMDLTGLDYEKIVHVFGSFEGAQCSECRYIHNAMELQDCIEKEKIMICGQKHKNQECQFPVKPNITFFGEPLQQQWKWGYKTLSNDSDDPANGHDLMIIIGSNLKIMPFNQAVNIDDDCPQVLIGSESALDFGFDPRCKDMFPNRLFLQGDCDETIMNLIKDLNWDKDFEQVLNYQPKKIKRVLGQTLSSSQKSHSSMNSSDINSANLQSNQSINSKSISQNANTDKTLSNNKTSQHIQVDETDQDETWMEDSICSESIADATKLYYQQHLNKMNSENTQVQGTVMSQDLSLAKQTIQITKQFSEQLSVIQQRSLEESNKLSNQTQIGVRLREMEQTHLISAECQDEVNELSYDQELLQQYMRQIDDTKNTQIFSAVGEKELEVLGLEKGESVGSGAQAEVFKVTLQNLPGQTFVDKTKKVKNNIFDAKKILKVMFSEFNIAKELDHPHIIKYKYFMKNYEPTSKNWDFHIIIEYIEGQDMKSFINENQPNLETIKRIGMQLLQALDYLHQKKIIHQDIKPENLMISKDHQTVKMIDFGVSNKFEATIIDPKIAGCGTLRYMSPEQLKGRLSFKSDMWSLGCLLLQMSTGLKPFHDVKNEQPAALKLIHYQITPLQYLQQNHEDKMVILIENTDLYKIINSCLQLDYKCRPTAKQLMNEPFFK